MADNLLKTAFMAVASCSIVHIGFAAFGVETFFHGLGDFIREGFSNAAGTELPNMANLGLSGTNATAGACHFHGNALICH